MYSGITRGLFPVVDVEKKPGLIEYVIELNSELIEELTPGASISVDGVCQTAVTINGNQVECHAMQETLSRTTLSNLHVGQMVSIERSLRYGDEIGGHEVAGHIIGTATVVDRNTTENNLSLTLECPPQWMPYIQPKGFITINGSSLTIGETNPNGQFKIHLIPETLRLTNFGHLKIGDPVNLELDHRTVTIVDTVKRILKDEQSIEL